MLKVMGHDLLVICGFGLVSEPVKSRNSSALIGYLELRIHLDAGSLLNRCHLIGTHECFHQHFLIINLNDFLEFWHHKVQRPCSRWLASHVPLTAQQTETLNSVWLTRSNLTSGDRAGTFRLTSRVQLDWIQTKLLIPRSRPRTYLRQLLCVCFSFDDGWKNMFKQWSNRRLLSTVHNCLWRVRLWVQRRPSWHNNAIFERRPACVWSVSIWFRMW